MQEFCIKMSKNDETVAEYSLELCTYVIQNVLNTFSNTEKEILDLFGHLGSKDWNLKWLKL